jgi:hypothetical protein
MIASRKRRWWEIGAVGVITLGSWLNHTSSFSAGYAIAVEVWPCPCYHAMLHPLWFKTHWSLLQGCLVGGGQISDGIPTVVLSIPKTLFTSFINYRRSFPRRLDQIDIPLEEGHLPKANYKPISLANLVLDEKYKNNSMRAILQLHKATRTIAVTPASSVCYLNIGDNLESKAK